MCAVTKTLAWKSQSDIISVPLSGSTVCNIFRRLCCGTSLLRRVISHIPRWTSVACAVWTTTKLRYSSSAWKILNFYYRVAQYKLTFAKAIFFTLECRSLDCKRAGIELWLGRCFGLQNICMALFRQLVPKPCSFPRRLEMRAFLNIWI